MEDTLTKEKGALSLRNLIMLYNVVKDIIFITQQLEIPEQKECTT